GVAGASAGAALLRAGARVLLSATQESAASTELVAAGARYVGDLRMVPAGVDAVIASPGLKPQVALLVDARARGLPVLGEIELAWQLRGTTPAPWLAVTGTNGKTTTVHMLESILGAAGLRALAVGNVGVPIIDAVLADEPYDVLAVELSSQQLQSAPSIAPAAGALLNVAADHLDWHGSMQAYALAKTRVWQGAVAIGNLDDAAVVRLFDAVEPSRRVGVTLRAPAPGQFGVVDGTLVERAADGTITALVAADLIRPAGAHNVSNALFAAALARAHGLGAAEIERGLLAFVPDPHRNVLIATVAGVDYVDDSKATNPHAAAASLTAYQPVVWIAGGQLKDAPVDELVRAVAPRLRGAVLLGADRDVLAAGFARHAPDLPLIKVARTDDGAMTEVVRAAAGMARPGDTVLLAPAAASYDMFSGYGARGDAFATAVAGLGALPEANELP
ncbi:MAG TPA: UDP-N-acetylmuramoyl-L-alanine--D-glutamate ligase, partial [Jatrophihabitantaceae bacterium]|nr:UDP-N-acetylmuramoyl-L-alanine--D-glutamate ligase [Jatrophihabitantaceae bacterium]